LQVAVSLFGRARADTPLLSHYPVRVRNPAKLLPAPSELVDILHRACIAVAGLLLAVIYGGDAQAEKSGGILRIYHRDSPASMSIHEEGTNSVSIPMMAVFNNLVLYDQHVAQNSLDTIVPDLAESWSWSEDGTRAWTRYYGAGSASPRRASARSMIGTDYPFPWNKVPVDHILSIPGLSDEDRIAILGGTAAKLLGIAA
jgi:hypothetical protein